MRRFLAPFTRGRALHTLATVLAEFATQGSLATILDPLAGGEALLALANLLTPLARGGADTTLFAAFTRGDTLAPVLGALARRNRLTPIPGSFRAALLVTFGGFPTVAPGLGAGAHAGTVPSALGTGFGSRAVSGLGFRLAAVRSRLGARLAAPILLVLRGPAVAAILVLGDGGARSGHRGGAGEQ